MNPFLVVEVSGGRFNFTAFSIGVSAASFLVVEVSGGRFNFTAFSIGVSAASERSLHYLHLSQNEGLSCICDIYHMVLSRIKFHVPGSSPVLQDI